MPLKIDCQHFASPCSRVELGTLEECCIDSPVSCHWFEVARPSLPQWCQQLHTRKPSCCVVSCAPTVSSAACTTAWWEQCYHGAVTFSPTKGPWSSRVHRILGKQQADKWRHSGVGGGCIDLQIGFPVSTVTWALGVWTRIVWCLCWLEALPASPTACWESSTTRTMFILTPLRYTGDSLLAVIFKSQLQFFSPDVLSCCTSSCCRQSGDALHGREAFNCLTSPLIVGLPQESKIFSVCRRLPRVLKRSATHACCNVVIFLVLYSCIGTWSLSISLTNRKCSITCTFVQSWRVSTLSFHNIVSFNFTTLYYRCNAL